MHWENQAEKNFFQGQTTEKQIKKNMAGFREDNCLYVSALKEKS